MISDNTIILFTQNNEKTISRTLDGLAKQKIPSAGFIAIDLNSKDRTIDIINKFDKNLIAKDHKVSLTKTDINPIDIRNNILKSITTKFVSFLVGNVVYYPNKITSSIAHLAEWEGIIAGAYSDFDIVDSHGKTHRKMHSSYDVRQIMNGFIPDFSNVYYTESVKNAFNKSDEKQNFFQLCDKHILTYVPDSLYIIL